jgi:asparagine synthase (glutamine-hydrolysing)
MCGIVAVFSSSTPVDPEALRRATASLHHRGPDGQGLWRDASGRVGLGHARLSIIDLEGGAQPLANEDESIHAVVNGELYDFERQRAELEARGHHFRTRSDSEVLLHLYEEYGVRCVDHLRGEVAFVLWDARSQVLLAGRDRFGIKPLYYADDGDRLVLASEAKALFAAGVTPAWDAESFFQAASAGGPAQDRSLFAGVRQLPAGHFLLATAGHRNIVRYWDFDFPLTSDAADVRSDEEHAAELRAALDEAIRLSLRADVPVAVYLSGGLDSCSLLGLSARLAKTPPHAFTIAFDDPAYDELAIAQEMAAHAGAALTAVAVSDDALADDFGRAVLHAETTFNNTNGVAKFRLSRAVRDAGYKVVLTGEGADEILAGYPHFRRDMLLHNRAGQDPAVVARLLGQLSGQNEISRGILMPDGEGLSLRSVRALLGGFAPTWIEAMSTAGAKLRGLLSRDFLATFGARDPYALFTGTLDASRLAGRDPVHQAQYLWAKSVLPMFILCVLGDRMEMAHSIEGRVPFLDHHVAELAVRTPVHQKIRGMVEKHVLREAARPVLTETVYRRQKHPFFAPPATTTPGTRLYQLTQDTLRSSVRHTPFYDADAVVSVLDRIPVMDQATRSALDPVIVSMLSVAHLQRGFGLGGG